MGPPERTARDWLRWFANSVKLAPRPESRALVSTTCSDGSDSHSELSILRMNVETRVLDWATPRISILTPFCLR